MKPNTNTFDQLYTIDHVIRVLYDAFREYTPNMMYTANAIRDIGLLNLQDAKQTLQSHLIAACKQIDKAVYQRNSMSRDGIEKFMKEHETHPKIIEYKKNLINAFETVMNGEAPTIISKGKSPLSIEMFLFIYEKVLLSSLNKIYTELRTIIRSKAGKFNKEDVDSVIHNVAEYCLRDKVFAIEKVPMNEISSADTLRMCYFNYCNDIEVCKNVSEINSRYRLLIAKVVDGEIIKELEIDAMTMNSVQVSEYIKELSKKYHLNDIQDLSNTMLYLA